MGVVRALGFAKVPFFRVQEDFFAPIFWVFPIKRAFSRGKTRGFVKSGGLFGCCSSVRVRKSTLFFEFRRNFFATSILGFFSQEGLFSWEKKGLCEVIGGLFG